MNKADSLIDSSDIDENFVYRLFESNSLVKEACEKAATDKWEDEHKKEVLEAEKELQAIKDETLRVKNEREEYTNQIKEEQKKLEKLLSDVNQYEQMENSLKEKIQDKIVEAKKDVSDFLAQYILINPGISTGVVEKTTKESMNHEENGLKKCYEGEIHGYKQGIESIEDELGESGVGQRYRSDLAVFMYSTYINSVPLLFAGPNSESIGQAFSVASFGEYAYVLDCGKIKNIDIQDILRNVENKVIIIKNPFKAEYVNTVMDVIEKGDKYYVLCIPFFDDLMIEPVSLLDYVIPVSTELFVQRRANNRFIGKKRSAEYEEYKHIEPKAKYGELLRSFKLNGYVTEIVHSVVTDMHNINSNINEIAEYMFIFYSMAYLTGEKEKYINKLKSLKNVDSDMIKYIITCLGDIDD